MAIHALIVGLGNPGPRYAATRHNFGFMALDALIERADALGGAPGPTLSSRKDIAAVSLSLPILPGGAFAKFLCVKPLTYMNLSGRAVRGVCDFYKLDPTATLVIHDELDLPLGRLRIKRGGGNAGHNGLKSITQELGTPDFFRLRLGIGHPQPDYDVAGYVLETFRSEELPTVGRVLPTAVDAIISLFEEGLDATKQRLGVFDGAA